VLLRREMFEMRMVYLTKGLAENPALICVIIEIIIRHIL